MIFIFFIFIIIIFFFFSGGTITLSGSCTDSEEPPMMEGSNQVIIGPCVLPPFYLSSSGGGGSTSCEINNPCASITNIFSAIGSATHIQLRLQTNISETATYSFDSSTQTLQGLEIISSENTNNDKYQLSTSDTSAPFITVCSMFFFFVKNVT
jgi:hypothetical protein